MALMRTNRICYKKNVNLFVFGDSLFAILIIFIYYNVFYIFDAYRFFTCHTDYY